MIEEPPARQRRQVTLWTILVVASLTIGLLTTINGPGTPLRYLLGTLLLWVSAYPAWRYFADRERRIPFLPAMSAIYFFSYGMPAFHANLRVRGFRPSGELVEMTLLLALAGLVLLLIAFYRFQLVKSLPRLRLGLELRNHAWRILVVAYLCALVRVPGLRIPLAVAELTNFISFLPVVLLCGLFLLFLRGELGRPLVLLGGLLLLAMLLLDFVTGSVSNPAFTLSNLLFVYVAERGKLPIAVLAIAAVLLIPALGTKQEYRKEITRQTELSTLDKMGLFGDLIGGVFTGANNKGFSEANEVAENRVDHLSSFAYVIACTPSVVPYWEGATYEDFFWSFVPRILVPSKPKKTLGQDYGHRYMFLDKRDYQTSINLEQTVEMFANFGVWGVLVGMFVMGLLYRMLYEILASPLGDGGTLVAASIFRVLLNIESDFSLVFGSIVQQSILLMVVLYLLAGAHTGRANTTINDSSGLSPLSS